MYAANDANINIQISLVKVLVTSQFFDFNVGLGVKNETQSK